MVEKTTRYLLKCLDPLHVGTGGYRLGRVDNTVMRDPATDLPFIPGSSLAGVIRANAALLFNDGKCAGKHEDGDDKNKHCGEKDTEQNDKRCPICGPFGYTVGSRAKQGTVFVHDAVLALFPVATNVGPAWLTTASLLKDLFDVKLDVDTPGEAQAKVAPSVFATLPKVGSNNEKKEKIALGWLFLDASKIEYADKNQDKDETNKFWLKLVEAGMPGRLVVVSETTFATLVNMNMDVRTSVAIDPATGAAADGALFTYEAVPRGAYFVGDIVFSKPDDEEYVVPKAGTNGTEKKNVKVEDIVAEALGLAKVLGVGGMNTRGFGRLEQVARFDIPYPFPAGGTR